MTRQQLRAVRLPDPAPRETAENKTGLSVGQQVVQLFRPRAEESANLSVRPNRLSIDLRRLEKMGFLSPRRPVSRMSEEIRLVKRQILERASAAEDQHDGRMNGIANGDGTLPSTVMVTSSTSGEGKTFVAINLAISLALECDTYVLLVDGDVLRPSVFETLGLEPGPGLTDALEDRWLDLGSVISPTTIPKLSLLSAGSANQFSAELLGSQRMRRLMREMATRYRDRIVIYDSPPLLASSEAAVLAREAGQVLVVVEANRTSQTTLDSALDMVDDCSNVSLLLNKASPLFSDWNFGRIYKSYRRRTPLGH